ncbi:MAG: TolC family protein [Candidatus Eisenbacteria bacterium]|nr:TolC family protein [Candidatus Eisenbacteria bacterium]
MSPRPACRFLLTAAVAALILIGAARAHAAVEDTLVVGLRDCEARALERSEEIRGYQSELDRAQARYLVARSSVLPHVELSTTYTQQIESIYEGATGGPGFAADTTSSIEERVRALEDALPDAGLSGLADLFSNSAFASEHSWDATVSVRQKLFQGGFLWHSIAGARHALDGAAARRRDGEADVLLGVRQAYLDALWAERELEIAELGLRQVESQFHRVALRQEAGEVSEFERLRAEVQRDNQLPIVQWARNNLELARLTLLRLCNLPGDRPLALSSRLLDSGALGSEALGAEAMPINPLPIDTTGWVAAAYDAPALLGLRQQAEALRHAVSIAGAARWPEFSAFASLSRQAFPRDFAPREDDWKRDARAGLALQWTLFDGLETRGAIQEARVNRTQAELQLLQARESVRSGVIAERGELLRAAADLFARTRTVAVARRAYALAELRYTEGASGLIELEETRRDAQLAESNEARARHAYLTALARIERYIARPVFTDVAQRGPQR